MARNDDVNKMHAELKIAAQATNSEMAMDVVRRAAATAKQLGIQLPEVVKAVHAVFENKTKPVEPAQEQEARANKKLGG